MIRQALRALINRLRGKEKTPMLKVGDTAPAFTVQTHVGKEISLASLKGKKVVLWFYPKADTPG
jgi:peroxiredoxin